MRGEEGTPPLDVAAATADSISMDFYSPPADAAAGDAVSINMEEISGSMAGPTTHNRRGAKKELDAFDSPRTHAPTPGAGATSGFDAFVPNNATGSMVATLLRGAREQAAARGTFDLYGQIDALRPYFDVETEEVRQRLFWSFHPKKGSMLLQQYDLYSPVRLAAARPRPTSKTLRLLQSAALHRPPPSFTSASPRTSRRPRHTPLLSPRERASLSAPHTLTLRILCR